MAANDQTLSWMTFNTTVQQRSVFTQSLSLQQQLMLLWLCPNSLLQFSEERLKLHNFVKGGFTFIWLYLPVYKNITVKNWLSQCLYIFWIFISLPWNFKIKRKNKTKDDQKYNINFWKLIHRFFFFFFRFSLHRAKNTEQRQSPGG